MALAIEQAEALPEHSQRARGLSYTLGTLGKIYEHQGRWQEAQQVTQRALFSAQHLNAPEITYQWQWQLGRILAAQGETEPAITAYTEAVNLLQDLRQDLASVGTDAQFSFRDGVEPVYRQLVKLLVQGDQPSEQNLQLARSLIEKLQLAELDNFFQDDCLQARPNPIEQLDAKAAVIYPIILDDRLTVILSRPGQPLYAYSSPVTPDQVVNTINQLIQGATSSLIFSPDYSQIQQLYDWLIRPAAPQLSQGEIETLVFVMDGVLRNVPISALHDGNRFLIEDYNVALAPSLELLESQREETTPLNLVAAGIADARPGFNALPQVKVEIDTIANIIPQTEALLNQAFTEAQLQASVTNVPLNALHLATHGQFSSSAEDTYILTWDDRLTVKEFGQLLDTRQNADTPIDLLVLSACQTATGDNRAALGIAGMAVRSGARSTLATLWSLEDEAAATFMIGFYEALAQPGTTKGEAFRAAQLRLLKDPRFSRLYYWAPLVLVGNWR